MAWGSGADGRRLRVDFRVGSVTWAELKFTA